MASSDIFTTATQVAVLLAGRAPVWTVPSGSDAPALASDGVAMQNAARALVHVALREESHRRTARLTIPTWVDTAVYTVTIDGTPVGHDSTGGDADLEDTIDGIVDVITSDGTVNQIVTATAVESEPGVSGVDTVLIVGDTEADFSIDFTQDTTAVVAAVADRVAATARLWWLPGARPGSTPPTQWVASGDVVAVDRRGHIERYDVAGLSRLAVQLDELEGHALDGTVVTYRTPDVAVGPCLAEL
jgi:hypothetical protein